MVLALCIYVPKTQIVGCATHKQLYALGTVRHQTHKVRVCRGLVILFLQGRDFLDYVFGDIFVTTLLYVHLTQTVHLAAGVHYLEEGVPLQLRTDVVRIYQIKGDTDSGKKVGVAAAKRREFPCPFKRFLELLISVFRQFKPHGVAARYNRFLQVIDLDILNPQHCSYQ